MAENLTTKFFTRHGRQNMAEDLVYLVPNTVGRIWQKI
jgi:hypothetical protein